MIRRPRSCAIICINLHYHFITHASILQHLFLNFCTIVSLFCIFTKLYIYTLYILTTFRVIHAILFQIVCNMVDILL